MQSQKASSRCTYCTGLTYEKLEEIWEDRGYFYDFSTRTYPHHKSYGDLKHSAKNECDLCSLILKGCQRHVIRARHYSDETLLKCRNNFCFDGVASILPRSEVLLTIDKISYDDQGRRGLLGVLIGCTSDVQTRENPLPKTYILLSGAKDDISSEAPRTSMNTMGKVNYALGKSWYENCRDNHTVCFRREKPILPTRVIDVGTSSELTSIRLLKTEGRRAEYVALSHCWGGVINTVLTTDTMSNFCQTIDYATLPANFQDAITITKQLGFQYLWIDSLCIIQNSVEDWALEAGKMGTVYFDSSLTISALFSPSAYHGMLNSGGELYNSVQLSDSDTNNPGKDPIFASSASWEEANWVKWSDKCKLNTRGWTLQEHILSTRKLMFGAKQIHWSCIMDQSNASGRVTDLTEWTEIDQHIIPALHADNPLQFSSTSTGSNELHLGYLKLVQVYTRRLLTVASDMFPAFGGLCSRLQPILGGEYLAGLWSTDIRGGLLWTASLGKPAPSLTAYRAPSWSWASSDEEVSFSIIRDADSVAAKWGGGLDLLQWQMVPKLASNPFGEISYGQITVRAKCAPLKQAETLTAERLSMPSWRSYQYYDRGRANEIHEAGTRIEVTKKGLILHHSFRTPPDEPLPGPNRSGMIWRTIYKVMFVAVEVEYGMTFTPYFLLLMPRQSDAAEVLFERIGSLHLSYDGGGIGKPRISEEFAHEQYRKFFDKWTEETLVLV